MIESDELRKAVALRLRQLRDTLDMDRGRMAFELNIQRASYTKKERGELLLSPEQMHQLATRHQVNLNWLLAGQGPVLSTDPQKEEHMQRQEEPKQQQAPQPVPGAPVPGQMVPLEAAAEDATLMREYRQLLSEMERLPLLRYEILTHFHRFKQENGSLF